MDGNGWKWMEMDGNGWKWMEMDTWSNPVPGRCEVENDSFWTMQQGGPSPPTKVFAQAPAGYLLSLSAGSLEPGATYIALNCKSSCISYIFLHGF